MTMWSYLLDRSIYDHPGAVVTMRDNVRKWKDRPALSRGERVTIVRMGFRETQYGATPRLLVRNAIGREWWIDGTDVCNLPTPLTIHDGSG